MPIDYQSIRSQIKIMAGWDQIQRERKKKLKNEALAIFRRHVNNSEELKILVEKAKSSNGNLRCAVPTDEPLDLQLISTQLPENLVLLAADGSQIFPDRNDPFDFGLVNVGAIRFETGKNQSPVEMRESQLLFGEALHDSQGNPVGEEVIALKRDYQEREFLARLADQENLPVVALTDGPLELFREPRSSNEYQKYLGSYLEVLHRLARKEIATAGYVDKPRSDLVIRLLELTQLGMENIHLAGRTRTLLSLTDAELFTEILEPGTRSAIFSIQSPSTIHFKEELAIHFFYLNVGRTNHPNLARVEIPAWVSGNPVILNSVQAVLVNQCSQMGGQPYPYALHRAHEIALVKRSDKEELINLIAEEFHRMGNPVGGGSSKQYQKNLDSSRKRVSL